MEFSNNIILLFLSKQDKFLSASKVLSKTFSSNKGNIIKSIEDPNTLLEELEFYSKKGRGVDFLFISLNLPSSVRQFLVEVVEKNRGDYECMVVTHNRSITQADKDFIKSLNAYVIPEVEMIFLFPQMKDIIKRRFNKKQNHLMEEIDEVMAPKKESSVILKDIARVALKELGMKVCTILLLYKQKKKIKIGAVLGMGKHETEFRSFFDVSVDDNAVVTECIRKGKPIQYMDILADDCPYQYKEFAQKLSLKSILATPVFNRRKGRKAVEVLGVLSFYTTSPHVFQDDEKEFSKKISQKITATLFMTGEFQQEKEKWKKKVEFIEKVAAELNRDINTPKNVFETILNKGLELLMANRGCIRIFRDDGNDVEYFKKCNKNICNQEGIQYKGCDLLDHVKKNKRPLLIDDISTKEVCRPKGEIKCRGVLSILSVPMMEKEKFFGVITAEHEKKDFFTEDDVKLFETLAMHAVIAIENSLRYNEQDKQLRAQLIIKKLIEETNKLKAVADGKKRQDFLEDHLDGIIYSAIEEAGKIFNACSGFVVLAEFSSNFARRKRQWQFGMGEHEPPRLPIGVVENGEVEFPGVKPCITGIVIATGKSYYCPKVNEDSNYQQQIPEEKTQSALIIPLKFQGQTLGAFSLNSNKENGFSKDDQEILESIAGQLALLIKRSHYLNILLDISEPFKSIDNEKYLYNEIVERTLKAMGTRVCYLRTLDRDQLVIKASKGLLGIAQLGPLGRGEGISGYVVQSKKSVIIRNVQRDKRFRYPDFARENDLFAMMTVPIFANIPGHKKELVGVLNTYANRVCDFTNLDLQLVLSLAIKAGEAIKKAKLIKQLDELAKVDREMTSTSEKAVLQNITNIAKKILEADQVVLYQYKSDTQEDKPSDIQTPTVSGESIYGASVAKRIFRGFAVGVKLLKEKQKEFFIESFDNKPVVKRLYEDRLAARPLPYYIREKLKSVIILKLCYKKEIVGILFINYRYSKFFSPDEKRIAKIFAFKAALAISSIRKYESIDRLHTIGNAAASQSSIEKVLEKIADNAYATLNASLVLIYRYNSREEKAIEPPVTAGIFYKKNLIEGPYSTTNVIENLIKGRKNVFAPDVNQNIIFRSSDNWKVGGNNIPRFTQREQIRSCAAIILKVRQEIVGVMFINYRTRQEFFPHKKRIIHIFANQAAITIRNAELLGERERNIHHIEGNLNAIRRSGDKILKELNKKMISEEDILKPILQQAMKEINVDMGYIGLVDHEHKATRIRVCSDRYKKLKNALVHVFLPGEPWSKQLEKFDIYPGGRPYKKFADHPELLSCTSKVRFTGDQNVESVLRVPIYSNKHVLGIIVLESEKTKVFERLDAYAVVSLANQASMALQNYRLIQQLRKLRDVDAAILNEQDNLDGVLKVILKSLLDLIKKPYADIKLWDGNTLVIRKSHPPYVSHTVVDVDRSVSGIAIRRNKNVYKKDVSKSRYSQENQDLNTKSELVIPLKVTNKKEAIGVLDIKSDKLADFSTDDIKIVEMFARQTVVALDYADQIKANKDKIDRISGNLKAIRKSGDKIVKNLHREKVTEEDILEPILQQAMDEIRSDMGYIGMVDKKERGTSILVCSPQYNPIKRLLIKSYLPEKPWIRNREKFKIFLSQDKKSNDTYTTFARIPQLLPDIPEIVFDADKDVKSALRVPIYTDKEPLGIIVLERKQQQKFTDLEAYTVMSLANQAAIALQNYRLIRQLRRLREVDAAILREQDNLDKVLEIILNSTLELVQKEYTDIRLWDGRTLITRKSLPPYTDKEIIDVHNSITGQAILEKRSVYLADVSKSKRFWKIEEVDTKSELAIPFLVDDKPIGVLNIESEELDDFTEEDKEILEMMAGEAAIAIYLAQQKEKLREKEKEANIGYVTRESVHWVGNKIGPIPRRVGNLKKQVMQLNQKGILTNSIMKNVLADLEIITKGAASALSIKSDLIDESKDTNDFDIIDLIEEIKEDFNNEHSSIEITHGENAGVYPHKVHLYSSVKFHQLKGDRSHMGRVFHYILKNAFQAIEDRLTNPTLSKQMKKKFLPEIKIRIFKKDKKLVMDFSDNGIGIKDENRQVELFRPFHTTKGADRGSGVGLYFCRRTMENHGGKISLKNTKWGEGSTFRLEFPLMNK